MTIAFETDRRTRAEQRVLAALLHGGDVAMRHCEQLRPNDFSHDLHGEIFRAIRWLVDNRCFVCAVNVFHNMRIGHRAPPRYFFAYLVELNEHIDAVTANAGYYAAAMLSREPTEGGDTCGFYVRGDGMCECDECRALARARFARAYDALGRAYGIES